MKKKCIAGGLIALLLCAFFALSAGAVITRSDPFEFWSKGTYKWGYSYDSTPLSCTTTFSSVRSIWENAFPSNALASGGYFGRDSVRIEITESSSSSDYHNKLKFCVSHTETYKYFKGVTYSFCLRVNLADAYYNATHTSIAEFSSLTYYNEYSSSVNASYIQGTGAYSDCFLFSITPNGDIEEDIMTFTFSLENSVQCNNIQLDIVLSGIVANTEQGVVPVDPSNDTLKDINDNISKFVDGEYKKPTPGPIDDGLSEDYNSASEKSDDVYSNFRNFISNLPSSAAEFWKNTITTISSFGIISPFFICGCGFCVIRIILGR